MMFAFSHQIMLPTRLPFFILLLAAFVFVGCKRQQQSEPTNESSNIPTLDVPMPTAEMLAALGPENDIPIHRLLPDPVFVVAGKPKQILASPLGIGNEYFISGSIIESLRLHEFGIVPGDIELFVQSNGFPARAQMIIPNPQTPTAPPMMRNVNIARQVTLITFTEPFNLAALLRVDEIDPAILNSLRRTEGKNEYYDLTSPDEIFPQRIALGLHDARTIIIAAGLEADIKAVFSDTAPKNAILERLKHTPVHTNDLTILTSLEGMPVSQEAFEKSLEELGQAWEIPPNFLTLINLHLRALTLSLNTSAAPGQPIVSIHVEGRDEKGTANIEELVQGLTLGAQTALAANEAMALQLPIPSDFAVALLNNMSIDSKESRVSVVLNNFETLIPTVAGWINDQQTAVIERDRWEERMWLQQRHAEQLEVLAEICWAYYMEHKKFPADILDADGKPLLSWRVALLPTLGGDATALYSRFKLDEPWDSEANLEAQKMIPNIFHTRSQEAAPSKTVFRRFNSPGTPFSNRDLKLEDVEFPLSTLMFVVVSLEHAVEWAKPDSLSFDLDTIADVLGDDFLGVTFSRRIVLLPVPRGTEPEFEFRKRYVEAVVKGLPLPQQEVPTSQGTEE